MNFCAHLTRMFWNDDERLYSFDKHTDKLFISVMVNLSSLFLHDLSSVFLHL